MRYRPIGNTGMSASVIGLGTEHLDNKPYETVEKVINASIDQGFNIMDLFMPGETVRKNIGKALAGKRDKMLIQGHICSTDINEQYDRSRDLPTVKKYFDDLLRFLNTDYIDFGMLFFIDTDKDFSDVFESDILRYAQDLKRAGRIRAIGASSHNPFTARRVVETGVIDLLMFSVNPAFDMAPSDTYVLDYLEKNMAADFELGLNEERAALYRICERRNVAITVMKTLGAGKLISGQHTPFSRPLTVAQCIHYALTRPAVVSALLGCATEEQVLEAAAYLKTEESALDYSGIIRDYQGDFKGRCVYCSHCLPCPAKINIAEVHKELDALSVDALSVDGGAPGVMKHNAAACTACGSCEKRCPFSVPVIANMKKAASLFSLNNALSKMILSASGWRGIFAADGSGESPSPNISTEHAAIAFAAAKVFSDYLKEAAPGKSAVIVGRDTRPTGAAIADAVARALLAEGRQVRYTGAAAAPEIMAFARSGGVADNAGEESAAGFMYISASHNPIGHNGIKFGLTDGGVLPADESARLAAAFRSFVASPQCAAAAAVVLSEAQNAKLAAVYAAEEGLKKAAKTAYLDFSAEVISGHKDRAKSDEFFASLKRGLVKRPLGIAADFNGSARTVSIDRDFFSSLGVRFHGINERPGSIVHRIVPEGESLDACRAFLEELHQKDPSVILGYMPDCDGDRGNLVIWDEAAGKAKSLEAQEVFALACVAELSSMVYTGELQLDAGGKPIGARAAVAVNDPTSLRIDRIARAFGASVFRAEVGEANVVGLARKLRGEGCLVRILGEGSAGGTITHPSAVRDPLDTLGALLKLLAIRRGEGREGLFEIWCRLSNQAGIYREDFTLSGIIASLPAFATTGAYSEDALLRVNTVDHALLKEKYEAVFRREWEEKKETLKERFGFTSWEAIAYNGLEEKRGISRFSEAGRGGLKIEFFRQGSSGRGAAHACIWMRGSGTEPVFRVMADAAEGDAVPAPGLERYLIEWQRSMVMKADNI